MVNVDPSFVKTFSSVVLAIFTIVLALVTYLYYRQSRAQTTEMRRSRGLQYEPKLKAGVKGGRPNFEIGFVNIGEGTAHDVEAQYWIEGLKEYQRSFETAVHFPDEIYRIGFPVDDSAVGEIGMSGALKEYVDENKDTMVVEWSYKNANDEERNERQEFSIFGQIEGRSESTVFYTDSEDTPRF